MAFVMVLLVCYGMIIFVENPDKELIVEMHVRLRFSSTAPNVVGWSQMSVDIYWYAKHGALQMKRKVDLFDFPTLVSRQKKH